MQSGATTLSFTASPVGEGKWYATREYHALNGNHKEYLCCLKAGPNPPDDFVVKLDSCSDDEWKVEWQQWRFGHMNRNPEIMKNYPEMKLDELKERRLEENRAVGTTLTSPLFSELVKVN